jgi:predicted transcriptional regulator
MAPRTSPKSEALELIRRLEPDATWDEILNELYVRQKIAGGLAAVAEGRVISHEEVKRRFLPQR